MPLADIYSNERLVLCHLDLLHRSFPALRNSTWRLSPVLQPFGLSIGLNRDATIQLLDGLSGPRGKRSVASTSNSSRLRKNEEFSAREYIVE